jgi:hypothetical protein
MTICQKRRDEFIGLLNPWYEMKWSNYFDLSDVQAKVRETFEVSIWCKSFIELFLFDFSR